MPEYLSSKLIRKYGDIDLQDKIDNKILSLRGLKNDNGINWFGLVSEKFQPLDVKATKDILKKFSNGKIRYNPKTERFMANYKIAKLPGTETDINFVFDSGNFGTYGGNGESAFKAGISIYDSLCTNWTLFLRKNSGYRKFIHRNSSNLEEVFENLNETAKNIGVKWEKSKEIFYDLETVAKYAEDYGGKNKIKGLFNKILPKIKDKISLYDLSWNITKEAQKLNPISRMMSEMLAGELIVCYENIMAKYN